MIVVQDIQLKLVRWAYKEDPLEVKALSKKDVTLCCLVGLLELLYVRSLALRKTVTYCLYITVRVLLVLKYLAAVKASRELGLGFNG